MSPEVIDMPAGIEFIGDIHSASAGGRWSHFRAPDGNIYEITQLPVSP
jgi:hypothetical protein